MLSYKKVLFVCRTDTCRGPVAAAIFNRDTFGREIKAESRGLIVLFPEPANPKAVAVAKSRDIHLENHKTKQLKAEDFAEDVLVLVMGEKSKAAIYEDFLEAVNVYTLKEFIDEVGDIGNPYGGDLQTYGEFYDDMEQVIAKVIYKLFKEDNK